MKRRGILGVIIIIAMAVAVLSAGLVMAGGNVQESDPVASLLEWGFTEAEATTLVDQGQAGQVLEALAEYEAAATPEPEAVDSTSPEAVDSTSPEAVDSTSPASIPASIPGPTSGPDPTPPPGPTTVPTATPVPAIPPGPPPTATPPPPAPTPTATPAPAAAPTATPVPAPTPTATPTATPTPAPEPEAVPESEGGQQAAAGAAPDYNILSVGSQDGYLVVQAEHYRDDGTFWFSEYYTWSGKEGVMFEVATNLSGERLLSDGSVAPYNPNGVQYVPEGEGWLYTAETLLTQDSIERVIASVHNSRTGSGYPGGTAAPPTLNSADGDTEGADTLAAEFGALESTDFSAD